MTAPVVSIPDSSPEAPCVEGVLSELRYLNDRNPHTIYLESRALQSALRCHGYYADLATVESAVGWLLVDGLEITA